MDPHHFKMTVKSYFCTRIGRPTSQASPPYQYHLRTSGHNVRNCDKSGDKKGFKIIKDNLLK